MKHLHLLFLLLFFIITPKAFSQEKHKDCFYSFEFEFTGEVTESLDSTFVLNIIIEDDLPDDVESIEVNYSKTKASKSKKKEYNQNTIKSKYSKKYISLGKVEQDMSYFKLYYINKSGDRIEMKQKKRR